MGTLQVVFVCLASALLLFWLAFAMKGPTKVDSANVLAVLRYGSGWRVLALVFAWTPPAVMIYVVVNYAWRDDATLSWAGGSFLATSIIAGLLLVEVERVQIVLSEDGVARLSPWTGRADLKWIEIERIDYAPLNRWIVVTGAGRTIRLSRYLVGIGEFITIARRKLPPERYTGAAAIFNSSI